MGNKQNKQKDTNDSVQPKYEPPKYDEQKGLHLSNSYFSFRTSVVPYYEYSKIDNWIRNNYKEIYNAYFKALNQQDDFSRKVVENIKLLVQYYNYTPRKNYNCLQFKSVFTKHPMYVYKVARIYCKKTKKILHNAVALVILELDGAKVNIVESASGVAVKISQVVRNVDYCCDKANVYAIKVVTSNFADTHLITNMLLNNSDLYEIVSNFDIDFKYKVGKHIIEGDFGKPGRGCYQGIHWCANEQFALRYAKNGMINHAVDLPYISNMGVMPEVKDAANVKMNIVEYEGDPDKRVEVFQVVEAIADRAPVEIDQLATMLYGNWYS
jgi:hypothetical protein